MDETEILFSREGFEVKSEDYVQVEQAEMDWGKDHFGLMIYDGPGLELKASINAKWESDGINWSIGAAGAWGGLTDRSFEHDVSGEQKNILRFSHENPCRILVCLPKESQEEDEE